MKRLRALLFSIWDFVVGDDWLTAAGVVAAIGLTALAAPASVAWLIMPVAVALLLTRSVWQASRVKPR